MKITEKELRAKNASRDQLKLFTKEWPGGIEITLKNCIRAAELGLDLDWFVKYFATATARAAYKKATAPARAEHEKAIATARAEYQRTIATARAEHKRTTGPAWAAYEKATARACFRTFKEIK